MIRRLTEQDDALCQKLIQQRPAENLFIIGDIEAFGYEEDFQTVWGDFDTEGNLRAVLLRYRENFIPFSMVDDFDAKGFATIINESSDYRILSGLKDITEKVEPFLTTPLKEKRQLYYAKLTDDRSLVEEVTEEVKIATLDDIPRLVDLLTSIPEFSSGQFDEESKRKSMEKGVARSYFIEKDGQMVASASTTAENRTSAMIVGVCTAADYQKRGYASQCMIKLCADVLKEGKELCLFYDNPNAGKIYKKLGFKDIGYWMMNKFE
ncbi:GNAT family N-acetyltransferase [Bacillaceae bacterium S4-13-58]